MVLKSDIIVNKIAEKGILEELFCTVKVDSSIEKPFLKGEVVELDSSGLVCDH